MSARLAPVEPEDEYLTLDEVAALFHLHRDTLRKRMARYRDEGFPMPAPWCQRPRRWSRQAVLDWKRRQEIKARAVRLRPVA